MGTRTYGYRGTRANVYRGATTGGLRSTLGRGRPLEDNPWFRYDIVRLGEPVAVRNALQVGRPKMTTPGPDCGCGRPMWFRPEVGKHTCYACQPGAPVDGAPAVPPVPYRVPDVVTLDEADIEVTYDHMGRDYVIIPDDVARAMRAEIQRGWREFPGQAAGESRRFAEGHWMYTVTRQILAVFAASPTPPEHDDHTTYRYWAGQELPWSIVFIAGRTTWDPAARWWAGEISEHRDLHVSSPYPHTYKDAAGKLYVRYEG